MTCFQRLASHLLHPSLVLYGVASAPQEVKIPAGPRLVILDHIETYRHILRPAMPIPKNLPHA
jgi:hypothetical protein